METSVGTKATELGHREYQLGD